MLPSKKLSQSSSAAKQVDPTGEKQQTDFAGANIHQGTEKPKTVLTSPLVRMSQGTIRYRYQIPVPFASNPPPIPQSQPKALKKRPIPKAQYCSIPSPSVSSDDSTLSDARHLSDARRLDEASGESSPLPRDSGLGQPSMNAAAASVNPSANQPSDNRSPFRRGHFRTTERFHYQVLHASNSIRLEKEKKEKVEKERAREAKRLAFKKEPALSKAKPPGKK